MMIWQLRAGAVKRPLDVPQCSLVVGPSEEGGGGTVKPVMSLFRRKIVAIIVPVDF